MAPEFTNELQSGIAAEFRAFRLMIPYNQRYIFMQKQAKSLLEAFFEWLHTLEDSVDRSPLIGKAVLYALNQEVYLKRYLEDGHLSIDNLAAECSLI